MSWLVNHIQVNIPFTMLYDSYLDRFIESGLNPEIGFDAQALDQYGVSEIAPVAKAFHERNATISLHGPFFDLSPGSPDPKIRKITRQRFEQLLELVPLFRPKTIVCHIGYDEKRYWYDKDLWVERSLEMWSWFGDQIRSKGSRLMLENVYEHGPEDIRIFFERLEPERVGFCLDTGHQAVFGRVPLITWVESLGTFLGQVHLHDNGGDKDEHSALGQGKIDFRTLLRELRAIKKDPPMITLEPHREQDLWPSLEYLEKIWPWER